MKRIDLAFAQELIDYAPTRSARKLGFGVSQLEGAVAAYNMLAGNRVAYLADEVGMGKTFVALGVWGLLRHLQPDARVVVIAPRENIQRKWVKEHRNFVRSNWLVEDNCVKDLSGQPVYDAVVCSRAEEVAAASQVSDRRDFYLRMTAFSVAAGSADSRKRYRRRVNSLVPWTDQPGLHKADPYQFRDAYGRSLNAVFPDIDLLIVDEAHNLRHGYGPRVSNRNRVLGLALGHPDGPDDGCDWYGPRVKRALLLSATPFEYDYGDLLRQLDVLSFGEARLRGPDGNDRVSVRILGEEVPEEEKRAVTERLLIRRVAHLNIGGKPYSKNMYRREWRRGGLTAVEEPMRLTNPRQRLVVGLIQKKVAEILGGRRFNNAFQIGMLSSFESFLESMAKQQAPPPPLAPEAEDEAPSAFDGDQGETYHERAGVDSAVLEKVVRSYRDQFGMSLPHPKLDATADALRACFDTGEKTLVFVRRVATVAELKAKLDRHFDAWIERRMKDALPALEDDIDKIFSRFRREQRDGGSGDSSHADREQVEEDLLTAVRDDEGGYDSFFAWYFRGEGPSRLLSGAAFQKNRLSSMASVYATLFEEDYVSWLLGRPNDPLDALAAAVGEARDELVEDLRHRAFAYLRARTKQKAGYPRFYVFEAYQAAGLERLRERGGEVGARADLVLQARFIVDRMTVDTVPSQFPPPSVGIGAATFFTEIVNRPSLRERIWPRPAAEDFIDEFREREQRRELISALVRLGASYIDLYLCAVRQLGSFALRVEGIAEDRAGALVGDFLDLLEKQAQGDGLHAFHELSNAAAAFAEILATNFPEAHHAPVNDLPEIYGRTLQHQVPVGGMSGGVNKRMVRQFRMPGFPLVLVTTDVLQEGEDLHLFCRSVVHYGITWTPSAMEQRTGRIDRIGSLTQRRLDGRDEPPGDDELIQVYFPHLRDTVEVFQVRRVFERLNRFLRMIHINAPQPDRDESRIVIAEAVLDRLEEIPPVKGLLQSAYPVRADWLSGEIGPSAVRRPDHGSLEAALAVFWTALLDDYQIEELRTPTGREVHGLLTLADGAALKRNGPSPDGFVARTQSFVLRLRSQVAGHETLLQCDSPVGWLNLDDPDTVDELYRLQRKLGEAKVCARHDPKRRAHRITVENDRIFRLAITQPEEIERLVVDTAEAADALEVALFDVDDDLHVPELAGGDDVRVD